MRNLLLLIPALMLTTACEQTENGELPPEPTVQNDPSEPPPPMQDGRRIPLEEYAVTRVTVDGNALDVYIADDDDKRREGLMFVRQEELGENEGMIFVFDAPRFQAFWMKNTPLPLDIAYLTEDGEVINILTMRPFDESLYHSDAPAKYAVETHAGWFERNRVREGARFDLSGLYNP